MRYDDLRYMPKTRDQLGSQGMTFSRAYVAKPLKSTPNLSTDQIAQLDARQEDRAETLQALDDLVEGVVNKLESAGVLDSTYIFFTSDNGFEMGEHRILDGKDRKSVV